jgi:cephalosporin hydroxylase
VSDDRVEFEAQKRHDAAALAKDVELTAAALDVFARADEHSYSYLWSWLGVPIIQIPQDILVVQEIVWAHRPQLIIETGVARGGSVILFSSLLELIGEGTVVGIDVDIRAHNRATIEEHPMSKRVRLVEGSSTDQRIVEEIAAMASSVDRVMVVLDSNHTHEHVSKELELYADFVTPGQFLVVADTVVESLPPQAHRPRDWGPGNNPATALAEFLARRHDFAVDDFIDNKLLMSSSPGGYLRRLVQ